MYLWYLNTTIINSLLFHISAETELRRQDLTSVDVRFGPRAERLMIVSEHSPSDIIE